MIGKGPDEFLQRLRDVFIRFREKNLFLKAKKCKFGVTRLEYVGRVISKEGLSMSAEKIKSVLQAGDTKTPKKSYFFASDGISLINLYGYHILK